MLLPATNDAKFFSRLGIQTYGFTPMVLPEEFNFMQTIHAADERIPVEAPGFWHGRYLQSSATFRE